jgi:hypothetical protein
MSQYPDVTARMEIRDGMRITCTSRSRCTTGSCSGRTSIGRSWTAATP